MKGMHLIVAHLVSLGTFNRLLLERRLIFLVRLHYTNDFVCKLN